MGRPGGVMAFTLDHVGVVVRDLDAALTRFSSTFGWTVLAGAERLEHLGVTVAYLHDGDRGPLVQFVCPLEAGPLRDFLDVRGEGLHHLCFAVDDIRSTVAALAPGAEVRIVRGGRGRLACFLPQESSGVRIELTEARPSLGEWNGTA